MLDDFMEIIGWYFVITALTIIVLLNSNISSKKILTCDIIQFKRFTEF